MKMTLALPFFLALVSCSTTVTTTQKIVSSETLMMKTPVAIGKTLAGQEISLGGLSSLFKKDENSLYALTDRGPIAYSSNEEKPFVLPDYSPMVLTLDLNIPGKTFEVTNKLPLKKKDGSPLTGLPNVRTEENPIDMFGFMHSLDADGLDTEGLVHDEDGSFWVSDEYAPSIVHFSPEGKTLRRLTPANNDIPKMYAERKTNRGFEALAIEGNKIYAFLQSPLPADKTFARIVEVEKETLRAEGEYFYGFDHGMEKIGDAVGLGNKKFIVIEMNGKKGPESKKLLYKITLGNSDELVKKELLLDLKNTAFKEIEKVEGIALLTNKKLILANDNDFGINGAPDFKTGMIALNQDPSMLLVIEFAEDLTK